MSVSARFLFIGLAVINLACPRHDTTVGPSPNPPDLLKSWTAGTVLNWTVDMVDMRFFQATFTGEEQWLIESVDPSPGPGKYKLRRFSTGTGADWGGSQQLSGLTGQFTVGEEASGLLYIPMNSSLELGFPRDTLVVGRHETNFANARVGSSLPAGSDTLRVASTADSGFTEFYHSTPSYRISYKLKSLHTASSAATDYMPQWSLGDTSLWDYYRLDYTSTGGTILVGKSSWKVIAVDDANNTRVSHIQRIFSGGWSKYALYPESTWVSPDTVLFQMTEDAAHKITTDLTPPPRTTPVSFCRYYASVLADTITISPANSDGSIDPSIFRIEITLRKGYGLLIFQDHRGSPMLGSTVKYTRIR